MFYFDFLCSHFTLSSGHLKWKKNMADGFIIKMLMCAYDSCLGNVKAMQFNFPASKYMILCVTISIRNRLYLDLLKSEMLDSSLQLPCF